MENQNKKCPAGSFLNLNSAYTINIRIIGVITPSCDPTNSAKLMIDMLNPSATCACPAVCLTVTQSLLKFQIITGLKTIRLDRRLI